MGANVSVEPGPSSGGRNLARHPPAYEVLEGAVDGRAGDPGQPPPDRSKHLVGRRMIVSKCQRFEHDSTLLGERQPASSTSFNQGDPGDHE